ncbi:PIG-L deacetylase family protein [Microbacterium sp. QXD-8]|uniref:PIG-L deacetylase family protein n=1 Tax=Microbacterium psychrotolerans TaxID=3068321 RepID=A0ABU0YW45_9MICO|nr:PIG-L deacetylase family protein [Microbacterium sp. QXD-8]MDQ7876549.1 PIG-L deacetylase family protein [Microbacterium sp. QXD-8]
MRVLAVGAHPDDVDLLCAGTLARYAAAGHDVMIAIATNGDVGSPTLRRDQIAKIRHQEARASAAVIGADLVWMGFEDEWLFNDRPTRTTFIDMLRRTRPDIVLAHSPHDYHPDHRIAGQLVIDAQIPSAVRLVETAEPALDAIPRVYTMDTIGHTGPPPQLFVDITSTIDVKERMLRAHVSQETWLSHIYGMEYVAFMRQQGAVRAAGCGSAYAEGFTELETYPPARPDLPPLGVF